MRKLYPEIDNEEDVKSKTVAECSDALGVDLPLVVLNRILESRRDTILNAVDKNRPIRLNRLGRIAITPASLDKKEIEIKLNGKCNCDTFRKELKERASRGELHVQNYTKNTFKRK